MHDAGEVVPGPPAPFVPLERYRGEGGSNRLYQGDNLAVLQALVPRAAGTASIDSDAEPSTDAGQAVCREAFPAGGSVDLVYIDPPYASGVDYASSPNEGAPLSRDAYRDTWGTGGVASYLAMLRPRLRLIRDLLAPTGSLFVHVGWQVNAHVRLMLDDLFGPDRLVDEIIWRYQTSSGAPGAALIKNHATIYHYAKGPAWTFNQLREPWPEATLKKWQRDEVGRIYRVQNRFGKRYYIDPEGKRIDDVWEFTLASRSYERTLYPTQKPEALLDRIIRMASNPGDMVADFFCGSGTTLAAAEKLGRRWIGCDFGELAIQTTRRRLLAIPGHAGFEILRAPGFVQEADSGPGPRLSARLENGPDGLPEVLLDGFEYARPDRLPARFRDRGAALGADLGAALGADWPEFLDEWAVDWTHGGEALEPAWVAFRTRKERTLPLRTGPHEGPVERVRVRVVDIFGNEAIWDAEPAPAPTNGAEPAGQGVLW